MKLNLMDSIVHMVSWYRCFETLIERPMNGRNSGTPFTVRQQVKVLD